MILAALLLLGLVPQAGGFTLDATAVHTIELGLPVDSVRRLVRDIGLLERHMPGVVEIRPHPAGGYWYRTEREIPFSGTMRTDFHVISMEQDDGTVTFRTQGTDARNWMSFRFAPEARSGSTTLLALRLRVRLVRDHATEIHVLAPVLGEGFLSEQMERDLTAMLQLFAQRITRAGSAHRQQVVTHDD